MNLAPKFLYALLLTAVSFSLAAQVKIGPVNISGTTVEAIEVVGDGSPGQMPMRIAGGGGAYFYAEEGWFEIDIYYYGYRPGRALLTAPDRSVLADVYFPGTMSGLTPPKVPLKLRKVTIKYRNRHTGVLALAFIPVNDWHGNRLQWGFKTNCPKYVIEASQAHRDARHLDPIILADERPGQICFPVDRKNIKIDISRAVPQTGASVLSPDGKVLAKGTIAADGKLSLSVAADPAAKGLYQLKMDKLKGAFEIDELTRWDHVRFWEDASAFCFWTPDAKSWFDIASIRHALFPFYKEIYMEYGKSESIPFRVRNQSGKDQTYTVSVEYPDRKPFLKVRDPQFTIKGKPKSENCGINDRTVMIQCTPPEAGTTHRALIRSTVKGGLTTYSMLVLHCKPASERPSLTMPFQFKPYRNGCDYMIKETAPTGEPYFDHNNKPYAFDHFLRPHYIDDQGEWHRSSMADGSSTPRPYCTKIAFDKENRSYFIGTRDRKTIALYWSDNGGKTYNETKFPVEANSGDIEVFSGANTNFNPPPLLLYKKISGRSKEAFWRQTNEMYLALPEIKEGKVVIGKCIKITDISIGTALHSGLASGLVSKDDKIHMIWGIATDPKDKSIKGVPTYVATYDRKTGELTKPVLIGFGSPANDVHNTPSILIDRKGYLHGFVGAHATVFQYARALKPNSSEEWTPAKKLGNERGGMTYIGAICDRNNRLHLIYRQYQPDPGIANCGFYSELVTLSKDADADSWGGKRVLFRPVFSDYSVYYHRLSIDRKGDFFMSLVYWSTYWFYRHDFESRRMVVTSRDNGSTWFLRD